MSRPKWSNWRNFRNNESGDDPTIDCGSCCHTLHFNRKEDLKAWDEAPEPFSYWVPKLGIACGYCGYRLLNPGQVAVEIRRPHLHGEWISSAPPYNKPREAT